MLESEQQPINHLLVVEDKQGKRTIALETATYSIGRDPSNAIVLDSRLASRHHAILLRVTTPDTANHLFRIIDGNLQGKRSTNGLIINGKRCFSHTLKHGDVIVFGGDAKAKYYASVYHFNEDLKSYSPEDISGFFSNLNTSCQTQIDNHLQTQIGSDSETEDSSEAALIRLASFPELISNPILEINLAGSITYLNPAAVVQFPDIRVARLEHPILAGVVSKLKNDKEKFFIREVEVANKVFEQSVHYIAESDLIRSYLVDVSERKQLEAILQLAHDKLETRVKERTTELQKANEQLRREIVERQRAEEEVRFLQTMMQAIAESTNFDSALEVVLRKVCEFTGWKFGEAWIPNSDGTALECSPAWYSHSHNLDNFRKSSTGYTFPPATGIPGRVWLSKHTEWIQDVSSQPETVFLRQQFLQEAGFKAGLGIPIIDNNQVLAVLIFFMFEAYEEDNRLVELVTTVSTQLGSLIQRKQAETARQESEERFRLLIDGAKDYALFMLDTDGNIISWNTGAERIKGYHTEEILGKHFSCFYSQEDIALGKPEQTLQICQANGQFTGEGWRVRKDGSLIWASVVINALRDQDGKLRGFSKMTQDITQRKQAEKALRDSEKQFRAAFNQAAVGIAHVSPEGKWLLVNQKLCDIVGYSQEELLELTFQEITHPDDLNTNLEYARQMLAQEIQTYSMEKRYIRKNGSSISANITVSLVRDSLGKPKYFIVVIEDIWKRKQAEEALQESEKRFRSAFNQAAVGIAHVSPEGKWLLVNQKLCDIVGYSQEELLDLTFQEITYPDDLNTDLEYVRQILANEIQTYSMEKRYICKDGSHVWINLTVSLVRHASEVPKYFIGVIEDISERKQAEQALHSSYATNRALLNAIPDLMLRLNKDGIFVNFKAAKDVTLPLVAEEFLGKHLYEVFPRELADSAMKCVQSALSTRKVQVFEAQLLANNHPRDYEFRFAVSAKNEAIAIVRDITQRKQAETEVRKALEKEKELGELKSRFVTMASHEFRTPLATILSSTELLEHYSHKWNEEKKLNHYQRIEAAVKQMTGLLNDVLLIGKAEAGKLEFEPKPMDLVKFCTEVVEEIQITTSSHTINFCPHGESANGFLDEKLLRHILTNLLSNAVKYSPQGGTVHFNLKCDRTEAVLQIQDAGIGIPPSDLEKLFETFHRASNVGTISGTGLGLAIVKKSVELHQGTITVESTVGTGTTFIVKIPLSLAEENTRLVNNIHESKYD